MPNAGDSGAPALPKVAEHDVQPVDNSGLDIDLEAWGEKHGYVLDPEVLKTLTPNWSKYQLSDDGTVLIPQPSSGDRHDPLNWTWAKKHIILLVIAATAFLPDFSSAVGAVTLLPQSEEWGLSEDVVNHSQVGNIFMLGAGGIFVVALAAYFGRLPVLFWFTLTAVWTVAGCAGSKTFEAFMALRILNGFFSTVAQGGGVMFIKDLFFFHERARKINIWASFVILSPYFGPMFTAFILTTQKWQWAFALPTVMTGLCLLLQIVFAEETFYDRKISLDKRRSPTPGVGGRISRLVGVEQWRSRGERNTFLEAMMRPMRVILKPTVFISTVYYLLTFAWVVGINSTLAIFMTKDPYDFRLKGIGFFYFTPVVAALLGEAIGHWLHDAIATFLTGRSSEKKLEPEYRLMAITISTPFMGIGLIVLGFALEEGWHYMMAALGWGLYVFGIMITTVAITSYNLDCYPEGSGEVAAWVNFARTTGGFVVSYFQVKWAHAVGAKSSFGTQAAICFFAYLMVIFLQRYGKKIREWSGPLKFKTD
ncbi:MFS transporter [Teratosphaeria nubilosa]|uniref:MFS transporter n=1 Tax=Teratosphaeria nubilosa TaxID=161662 RepID=A0A6G1L3Y0_9PEZI|nr:MFS transporter [Teratosphaeria nubilosa]